MTPTGMWKYLVEEERFCLLAVLCHLKFITIITAVNAGDKM